MEEVDDKIFDFSKYIATPTFNKFAGEYKQTKTINKTIKKTR